jgi:hypothetical protein
MNSLFGGKNGWKRRQRMKARKALAETATFLRLNPWGKGGYFDAVPLGDPKNQSYGSCFCAVGAIARVTKDVDHIGVGGPSGRAVKRLSDYLKHIGLDPNHVYESMPHDHVVNWNDQPERTKGEVLAALENAAKPRSEW